MAKIVWLLNGANNQNTDYHFSMPVSSILKQGVIEWLTLTQSWWAGTDISVNVWTAVVSVTRTSVIPNEVFLCSFRNTAVESLGSWTNKKIYIEISSTNVNNPALNTQTAGTWIWNIVMSDSYPSANYVKLWETDWTWLLSTSVFEKISFNADILNQTTLTWLTKNITTTWNITATNLYWNGAWITWISADIHWIAEDNTIAEWDEFIKYDASLWGNRKIKATSLLQSTKSTFVAWENITAWNALHLASWNEFLLNQISQLTNNASYNVSLYDNHIWQTFITPTLWISEKNLKITSVICATSNWQYSSQLVAKVYSSVWWTLLWTSQIVDTYTSNFTEHTLIFNTPVSVNSNTW